MHGTLHQTVSPHVLHRLLADVASGADALLLTEAAESNALLDEAADALTATRTRPIRVRAGHPGGLGLAGFLSQVGAQVGAQVGPRVGPRVDEAPLGADPADDALLQRTIRSLTVPDPGCDRIALLVSAADGLQPAALRIIQLACRSSAHLQFVLAGGPGLLEQLEDPEFAVLAARLERTPLSTAASYVPVPAIPASIAGRVPGRVPGRATTHPPTSGTNSRSDLAPHLTTQPVATASTRPNSRGRVGARTAASLGAVALILGGIAVFRDHDPALVTTAEPAAAPPVPAPLASAAPVTPPLATTQPVQLQHAPLAAAPSANSPVVAHKPPTPPPAAPAPNTPSLAALAPAPASPASGSATTLLTAPLAALSTAPLAAPSTVPTIPPSAATPGRVSTAQLPSAELAIPAQPAAPSPQLARPIPTTPETNPAPAPALAPTPAPAPASTVKATEPAPVTRPAPIVTAQPAPSAPASSAPPAAAIPSRQAATTGARLPVPPEPAIASLREPEPTRPARTRHTRLAHAQQRRGSEWADMYGRPILPPPEPEESAPPNPAYGWNQLDNRAYIGTFTTDAHGDRIFRYRQ